MAELTNRADYSFPDVEPALRKSLSLRTFRIPKLVADSKDDYWIQVEIGERVVIGQPVHTDREFVSLTRGIRASDIVYSYHSEEDGFSGGLDLSPTEIHGWRFNDPDPIIDGITVVLATAETIEGARARIVLAPRIGEQDGDGKLEQRP